MESCNVKRPRSSSAELKPNWRDRRQLGAKLLGDIIAMGVPLQENNKYETREDWSDENDQIHVYWFVIEYVKRTQEKGKCSLKKTTDLYL